MKSTMFKAVSVLAGAGAAVGSRALIGKLWPGGAPPKNPADRGVTWKDAITWAVASGIGAGVARIVAYRAAAGGWEKLTGDVAPDMSST